MKDLLFLQLLENFGCPGVGGSVSSSAGKDAGREADHHLVERRVFEPKPSQTPVVSYRKMSQILGAGAGSSSGHKRKPCAFSPALAGRKMNGSVGKSAASARLPIISGRVEIYFMLSEPNRIPFSKKQDITETHRGGHRFAAMLLLIRAPKSKRVVRSEEVRQR